MRAYNAYTKAAESLIFADFISISPCMKLGSFSGGLSDASYMFSPKHMNIDIPAHTNDECVTPLGITCCEPLSAQTDMSAAIFRIRLAELCREAADASPCDFNDVKSVDYNVVLALDQKFNTFRESLPAYLSLDIPHVEGAGHTKRNLQDTSIVKLATHFVILSRLCRLHRPYFMQSARNTRYSFSHRACVAAAQEMLDIRVAMEQTAGGSGVFAGFWTLLNHGFIAALILATDVSFNDASRQAQHRRKQVLDMCAAMERSLEDGFGARMEGVQRNLQTLIATVKRRKGGDTDLPASSQPVALSPVVDRMPTGPEVAAGGFDSFTDIGHLLLDFVDLVPEMDGQQWDSFFENTYEGLGQSTQPWNLRTT
ncbi:hypothetical protein NLG97_g4131 [Lecanicillium saksenae]|uniref:Uncharacterized protein n=1 Tax=Lecanicillium saksenae TaxID=468837 RepID=A0ACC1QZG1_9HYPO|nr:hypothetical protein NLG97_g4131 [Lecanicillium saksenae]